MSTILRKKLYLLATCYGTLLVLLILRLAHLQVFEHARLSLLGQKNMLRLQPKSAPRGNIVDSGGRLLATSRPCMDLYWEGGGAEQFSAMQHEVLTMLSKEPGAPSDMLAALRQAERRGHRAIILRDIEFSLLAKLQERYSQVQNLLVITRYERFYPARQLAAHVLGSVGVVCGELVGRSGVEKSCDAQLQGIKGVTSFIRDSRGRRLQDSASEDAQPGSDVHLTIDAALQTLAENAFPKDSAGAFVVMDARTGAIKALCSKPGYDPNLFTRHLSHHEWSQQFSTQAPFLCRATQALYPPASLFKLVTFAAGIEEGLITTKSSFHCTGATVLGDHTYACNRRGGHGRITATLAIAHSCNTPCYEIGKQIDIDVLSGYAHACGLGQRSGFMLGEQPGLVPSAGWKQATKGERWWQGETLAACIGQGYMLVTPLQLARMFGGICTGQLVRPRIVQDEPIEKKPIALSKKTRRFLVSAMRKVVSIGTARSLGGLKQFSIAAKTGTAQVVHAAKRLQNLEHGLFAGVASYGDEEPLVIVTVVEHVGSSLPAIRMAEKFLKGYAQLRS